MKNEQEVTSNNWWSNKCKFICNYTLSYCFYIHIILLISISIVQLRFSVVYADYCTIDDRIIRYLLVTGIVQVVYSFNGILLIIFSFLFDKYRFIITLLLISFVIQQILLIFVIIWFIIGNYLIFYVKNSVQYTNSYNIRTYCDYKLYQTAFWTIIIYYILILLFFMVLVFKNIEWFIKQLKYLKNKCLKIPDQTTIELV